jgi:PAS domain S-box-containing protein
MRLDIIAQIPTNDPDLREQLDRLAGLAARICETPVGLVSIVMRDEQVFFGRSGTELAETPREWSFCAHAMRESDCMVVPDATGDRRFEDNPLVTGAPGIRFYAGFPLKSVEGAELGSFCVIDTKPREDLSEAQHDALHTLALSAMGLLEKARTDARHASLHQSSSTRIAQLQQRFDLLSDAMPQLVWITDALGKVEYVNRGWINFVGRPAHYSFGYGWLTMIHPEDRRAAEESWSKAVDSRSLYEIEYRLSHFSGGHRWVLARGVPMLDDADRVHGWIGTCTDVHEQREAVDRLEILSRELNHRIKNIFAVIGGLISMTFRGEPPESRARAMSLQSRVLALGRAHDFVRTHAGSDIVQHPHTSLKAMLDALLAPYQSDTGDRILVCGDDPNIDDRSATPLALFFHELATNAAKYGALSEDAGQVVITVRCQADAVELEWAETGGPPVVPSSEAGFGARLIEMSIARQLNGSVSYEWERAGLRVTATVPLRAMAR